MEFRGKEIRCVELDQWLNGETLEAKIKTLEHGELLQCAYCGWCAFDKEKLESFNRPGKHYNGRPCRLTANKHDFRHQGYYIILYRGFRGILGTTYFNPPETPEEAILKYFIGYKKWNDFIKGGENDCCKNDH